MYRLTPRMLQRLERDLRKYHGLFDGGRCSGWELEELIVAAIKADTQAQHQVRWREAGHDDKADIVVRTNGDRYPIQVKSGEIRKRSGRLVLSGHRLGRYRGNFTEIGDYLNNPAANFMSVPYRQVNNDDGRQHIYRICYVDMQVMTGLHPDRWDKPGSHYIQVNPSGVEFSIRPTMSWQVWWSIPSDLFDATDEFVIG